MKCTTCQSELSLGARVCKHCGSPVSLNPSLEDIYFSRLTANAPPAFVQKVRSAPYLAKEQRTVTAIMFTISNVDEFNEGISEEERTPLLNQALDRFAGIIFQYEGTIAKLWENTVLAFIGAPISHEDDPLRAVHAAQAILDEVQLVSADIEAVYDIPLHLNLVINSGPVEIGDIKSNLKFDFRSLNNTLECMDLAIRAAIPHCEVIILDDTYQFIKPHVKCQKLEDIYCDEIDTILLLWQLDHLAVQDDQYRRMPVTQISTLVGRKRELDQLMELSETVLVGLGRVGVVQGDPGIGKSRLILEWKYTINTMVKASPVRWIEAHGSAFGPDMAYHLLKNLIRAALQVSETASSDILDESLQAALEDMIGLDKENVHLFLAHLLEIPLSDKEEEEIHHLNAAELRTQYLHTLRAFLRNLTFEQPLIIILDDLQWADASSTDLLIELLSMASTSQVLFCLVTRQDRDSTGWRLVTQARAQLGPRLTEIELENLNEEESQSLIREMLQISDVPDQIRKIVLGKSEGNPYFIEELIQMLVNENVLLKKNNQWVVESGIDVNMVPNSLQGLLTARIDRLPPEARFTLRVASVIGRSFTERVIEYVMADHAPDLELMEQLSILESIGMVKVAQVHPELTYEFKHILLHDAAYRSILERDSNELHLTVGQALEELYPEQKAPLASQLAYHFLQGQDDQKALIYLDMAGHMSMQAFATAEAENYFRQAIQLADGDERQAHLYADLGEVLAQQSKHREAIQAWKKAIHYYSKLNLPNRLARVYAWSARSAWWGYDPKRSLEICLEGLTAIEGSVESPDVAYLIHETGRAYLFNNQPEKARAYSEQALEMAKRLNAVDVQAETLATIGILPTIKPQQAISALEKAIEISEANNLYSPASRAYINLAAVIDKLGEIRLAREYQKHAIQLGIKSGGLADELMINQTIARASMWLADFEDAENLIENMRQVSRQKDAYLEENTLNLLYLEGLLFRLKGNFSLAMEIFNDLIDRSHQTNDYERALQANRSLAEIIIEPHLLEERNANRSNIDIALSMITDAVQAGSNTASAKAVHTMCLLSDIQILKGNLSKAEVFIESASRSYRDQPIMQDRVRIIQAQARLAAAQNNYNEAFDHLENCVEMLDKMEGRWLRARTRFEMGNLFLRRNEPEDVDQAHNLYRESLAEFKGMGVDYYPDLIIEKLRQVKHITRAQAIAHKKITRELAEAGRVQNTFIPTHSPSIPGYDISGVLLPANETSGDFYDFIELDNGKTGFVIADVGDKGAGAALYMAMSRTLIRTYGGEDKLHPEEVIKQVNRRILTDTQRGIFLTVVFGVLDPQTGTFTYVNAGHNPPYHLIYTDGDVNLNKLEKTGPLVGIFNESTWQSVTIDIHPDELLVLYTDGITEAQNRSGAFYGFDRLVNTLKKGVGLSAEALRNAILESVQAFTGPAPRLDDITLVVISRNLSHTNDNSSVVN